MAIKNRSITLTSSGGVRLEVWLRGDLFHVARSEDETDPEVCLGVDLFEVIAELAELDLDSPDQAKEANRLSEQAQRKLT
jgi:hypothetical protein